MTKDSACVSVFGVVPDAIFFIECGWLCLRWCDCWDWNAVYEDFMTGIVSGCVGLRML